MKLQKSRKLNWKTVITLALCPLAMSLGSNAFAEEPTSSAPNPSGVVLRHAPILLAQVPPRTPVAPRTPSTTPGTSLLSVSQLIANLRRAERESNGDALIYSYGEAARDPILARGALAHLMYDYYR